MNTPRSSSDAISKNVADKFNNLSKHRSEKNPKFLKTRRLLGRVATAAVCSLPITSLAISDVGSVKVLQVAHEHMDIESPQLKRLAENGVVGGEIMLASILEGLAITRSRRLKGASDDMDEYFEKRRKTMSKPRKALSIAANAPFTTFGYVGSKIEKGGDKIAEHDFRGSKTLGNFASDLGKVYSVGTSAVILQETMDGKTPDWKRNTRLAALITGAWIATVEGVRGLYGAVPALQPPLDWMGRAFEHVTTPDNPYSAVVLGAAALGLASTGWNVAKYHELKEAEEAAPKISESLE